MRDDSATVIKSTDVRHRLFVENDEEAVSEVSSDDFAPIAAEDREAQLKDVIVDHVCDASRSMRSATELLSECGSGVSFDIYASSDVYGRGRCNMQDVLVLVLSAFSPRPCRYETDENGVLHEIRGGGVSFADDDIVCRALGWFIDEVMSNLSQAPSWWDKFATIRNDRFHDGAKRHAMNVIAASMWCMGSRKWQDYQSEEYDYLGWSDVLPERQG